MTELCLFSPAKINLFLHVIGRRADGYHLLQTIFQFIDLSDDLHFKLRMDDKIILHAPNLNFPAEENLIVKAAKKLREVMQIDCGVDITLNKRIPLGAGLGGGSSNAATALVALNQLWQCDLNEQALADIGITLGADVPIFIYGKAAFAEGIGEKLQPVTLPEDWILLLIPPCVVETGKIFSDSQLTRNTPEITINEFFERGGHNDCEPIAKKYFPEIATAFDWLAQYSTAYMTGSGCGVFAIFKDKETAIQIATKAPSTFRGHVVKRLNTSPLYASFYANSATVAGIAEQVLFSKQ